MEKTKSTIYIICAIYRLYKYVCFIYSLCVFAISHFCGSKPPGAKFRHFCQEQPPPLQPITAFPLESPTIVTALTTFDLPGALSESHLVARGDRKSPCPEIRGMENPKINLLSTEDFAEGL